MLSRKGIVGNPMSFADLFKEKIEALEDFDPLLLLKNNNIEGFLLKHKNMIPLHKGK